MTINRYGAALPRDPATSHNFFFLTALGTIGLCVARPTLRLACLSACLRLHTSPRWRSMLSRRTTPEPCPRGGGGAQHGLRGMRGRIRGSGGPPQRPWSTRLHGLNVFLHMAHVHTGHMGPVGPIWAHMDTKWESKIQHFKVNIIICTSNILPYIYIYIYIFI